MKKLLMAFVTAALLSVCLCVPAFAVDIESLLCEHITALDDADLLIYPEANGEHYFGCAVCHWSFPFVDGSNLISPGSVPESYRYHNIDCPVCCFPDFSGFDSLILGVYCSHHSESTIYACTDQHVYFCSVCGYYRPLNDLFKATGFDDEGLIDSGHSDNCAVCSMDLLTATKVVTGATSGEIISSLTPSSVIPAIAPLVTNAIDWVSLVANCIVDEPLLLLFVCVSFVGIGIGFIKRIIHL